MKMGGLRAGTEGDAREREREIGWIDRQVTKVSMGICERKEEKGRRRERGRGSFSALGTAQSVQSVQSVRMLEDSAQLRRTIQAVFALLSQPDHSP